MTVEMELLGMSSSTNSAHGLIRRIRTGELGTHRLLMREATWSALIASASSGTRDQSRLALRCIAVLHHSLRITNGKSQGLNNFFDTLIGGVWCDLERDRTHLTPNVLTSFIVDYPTDLHIMLQAVRRTVKRQSANNTSTPTSQANVLHVLTAISPLVIDQPVSDHPDRLKASVTDAWITFMALPLTVSVCEDALRHLNATDLMTRAMHRPVLLADSLFACLAYKSSPSATNTVACLAVDSVVRLITRHNLDYPSNIFEAVFALLVPDCIVTPSTVDGCAVNNAAAARRSADIIRFTSAINRLLQSSHVPQYVIDAFAVRLAHLLPLAPAHLAVGGFLPVIRHLVSRHASVKRLLTTEADDDVASRRSLSSHDFTASLDAMRSHSTASVTATWPLRAVALHACPQVASASRAIIKDATSEKNVSKFWTDVVDPAAELYRRTRKRKATRNVTMNDVRPAAVLLSSF